MPIARTKFLSLVLLCCAFMQPAQADALDIWVENFKPMSYKNGQGKLAGFSVEIVKQLLDVSQVPVNDWHFAPWARVFQQGKNNKNTLIITVIRTPERDAYFHWIGPILTQRIHLYKLSTNQEIQVNSWHDVKKHKIAVLRSAASNQILQQKQLRLYELPNAEQILTMLFAGRAPLASLTAISANHLTSSAGIAKSDITPVWLVDDSKAYYIAVNKQTPAAILGKLDAAFLQLQQSGSIEQALVQYLR